MARVGAPLPSEQWPPGAAAMLDRMTLSGSPSARLAGQQTPASAAELAQWAVRTRAAATAWHALKPWKRWRWSLCAWRHRHHDNPIAPHDGDSGFRLYLECYLAQRVTAPKQPVSPCARRTWDQNASPWDYTP